MAVFRSSDGGLIFCPGIFLRSFKKGAVYIPVAPRSDRMHTAPYFILSPEGIQQGFIPNQNQFLRHWSQEEEPQGCFPPARIP